MKIILVWFISTFFLCTYSNSYIIKGLIRDSITQESLSGVSISIDSMDCYSDLDGNFMIPNLQSGKHTLRIELISYEPIEMEINLLSDKNININLIQCK
jgi:hypothetical protein